jgi:hypothetical protein
MAAASTPRTWASVCARTCSYHTDITSYGEQVWSYKPGQLQCVVAEEGRAVVHTLSGREVLPVPDGHSDYLLIRSQGMTTISPWNWRRRFPLKHVPGYDDARFWLDLLAVVNPLAVALNHPVDIVLSRGYQSKIQPLKQPWPKGPVWAAVEAKKVHIHQMDTPAAVAHVNKLLLGPDTVVFFYHATC